MKNALLLLLTISLFASCEELNKEDKKEEVKERKLSTSDELSIGEPLNYGLDSMMIFPIGRAYYEVEVQKEKKKKRSRDHRRAKSTTVEFSMNTGLRPYDQLAEEEYVNRELEEFDIRNILFYNTFTQEKYPLTETTLHILSFGLHPEYRRKMIFYRVVLNDYNEDGFLNNDDPVVLCISDLYGRNFTQITSDEEQFVDYTYNEETETIMIKTLMDSDGNKKFNEIDEVSYSTMKILEPAMATKIFTDDIKESLMSDFQ
ncbi:MAG: hypothetical protein AB8B56_02205 [Crocinitomicaceae bacterium]